MVENYCGCFDAFTAPHFAPAEKKEALCDEIFDKVLPGFMEKIADALALEQFICGAELTIADFWVAGLYVNLMNNPIVGFAPERWAKAKEDYPAYAAYGERFTAANKEYLDSRPARPL
jgi:glutathione S-transferase